MGLVETEIAGGFGSGVGRGNEGVVGSVSCVV